jgi:hypothetical protein
MAVPFTRPRATATRIALDGAMPGGVDDEGRVEGGHDDDGRVDPVAVGRRAEEGPRGGGVLPPGDAGDTLGRAESRVAARGRFDEERSSPAASSDAGSSSASRSR